MRHMLAVGPSAEMHLKAMALGLRVSALVSTDRVCGLASLEKYCRISAMPPEASTEEWVAAAELIHKYDPCNCVGPFSEPYEERAVAVANALGLRYQPARVIEVTHDKVLTRRTLGAAGLDDTPYSVVAGVDEVEQFGRRYGYPIVVKPVDGRASRGVSVVREQGAVEAAVSWCQQEAGRMLVEKYLVGTEWSVEAFSESGVHRIVAVTQKFKDSVHCVEVGHCVPAPLEVSEGERLVQFVGRVLDALKLQEGPSHTEVVLTADGPRVVETHARLAGDRIIELIELVSDVDLDKLWIRHTSGEQVLNEVPTVHSGKHAAIWYASPSAVGTLLSIEDVERVRCMPGVVRVQTLRKTGDDIKGVESSASRGAFVIAVGDDAQAAVARARSAAEHLRFVVSCCAQTGALA